jgi:hypothetical protein
MKLIIRRHQEEKKEAGLGGYTYSRFYLAMKVEFTSEEEKLLKQFNFIGDDKHVGKADYKMGEYVGLDSNGELKRYEVYLHNILLGNETFPIENTSQLFLLEDQVVQKLRGFKDIIERLRSFNKEEVVEI